MATELPKFADDLEYMGVALSSLHIGPEKFPNPRLQFAINAGFSFGKFWSNDELFLLS